MITHKRMREMKVSEITRDVILIHIRELKENLDETDIKNLEGMKTAAISYCTGYTGLSEKELDSFEDITIAVLAVISDMWDNRSFTVEKAVLNPLIDNILGLHSTNLLPKEESL